MSLTVGSKVIYPSLGPCTIAALVEKAVGGSTVAFYQLAILDESGGELFVPVDKAHSSGLRLLVTPAEIPQLLALLAQPKKTAGDWKQRAAENARRLTSGSAFDLVEVVESLSELSETKVLSFREQRMLEKARRLLICEISEVTKQSRSAAEEQVNKALKSRVPAASSEETETISVGSATQSV